MSERFTQSAPDRRFEALVFDWDGTAVPDRAADATAVRVVLEELCAAGMHVAIVSGTHVGNVDGQLMARPIGPGSLLLALNRGSEIFRVDGAGTHLVYRRNATAFENLALQAAAALTVERLAERGLRARIVSTRLNRRKIDLIDDPEWADPTKAQISDLLRAVEERLFGCGIHGLSEVVAIANAAAMEVGLSAARVTSDAKHVEIGLTDKADSARWIFTDLWRRGVASDHVLIAGDEFAPLGGVVGSDALMLGGAAKNATVVSVGVEPEGVPAGVQLLGGGPNAFLHILQDQRDRRRAGELPAIFEHDAWSLTVDGIDPRTERVHEALLTLADGRIGTSGAPTIQHAAATPLTLVSGLYRGEGPDTTLATAPHWHQLADLKGSVSDIRRTLDFRTGLLREDLGVLLSDGTQYRVASVRFLSLPQPGTAVARISIPAEIPPGIPVLEPADTSCVDSGVIGQASWVRLGTETGGVVAVGTQHDNGPYRGVRILDRVVAYHAEQDRLPSQCEVLPRLEDAAAGGFDHLLVNQRDAWAQRWSECDIVIEGDDELQKAVRFALFHLHGAAPDFGEAAVGARGLTGGAYRGHVFWDADVFVLPFFAATRPAAARAMLEYRIRRLGVAITAASALGLGGARFPWESARTGEDVTPASARDRDGKLVAIRTGQLEDHIVADVAWANACYIDWTGDEGYTRGPGHTLFVETARFWASRIRVEGDGTGHIYGVIGPDEYHEPVDDNVFTNVMARWNLRRAARSVGDDVPLHERNRWLALAETLTDGYDAESDIYEQFAGFHSLEPLIIANVAPRRPVTADLLLGRERVSNAQIIKQADVLMAHHLVPQEMVSGSLETNLRYYEPRTAHGSSLSPGVHAALFAHARDDVRALEALRIAARIDLDDISATTAGGLHLATLGSVWQVFAFGFAALRPTTDGILTMNPRLPSAWSAFEIRTRFRGALVTLRKERGAAHVCSHTPVHVRVGDCEVTTGPAPTTFVRRHDNWAVQP